MTKPELKKLKEATKKLSKWESSGKAFGHFKVIEAKATTSDGADRIYEFWCIMRLLNDLKPNYDIELEPDARTDKKIFPQAPSPKKGWAYFKIKSKTDPTNNFQVCYGTEIKLSAASFTTIAPDISVQKHDATDDPDETMVELIMDAKFKYNNTKTLQINELHAFMQRVNVLKIQNAALIPLSLSTLTNIKANCLLTNGKALSKRQQYCQISNVKQVERFDIGKLHNVIG